MRIRNEDWKKGEAGEQNLPIIAEVLLHVNRAGFVFLLAKLLRALLLVGSLEVLSWQFYFHGRDRVRDRDQVLALCK